MSEEFLPYLQVGLQQLEGTPLYTPPGSPTHPKYFHIYVTLMYVEDMGKHIYNPLRNPDRSERVWVRLRVRP